MGMTKFAFHFYGCFGKMILAIIALMDVGTELEVINMGCIHIERESHQTGVYQCYNKAWIIGPCLMPLP